MLLRVLVAVGSWPTLPTITDSYQVYAKAGPFTDPLHPAGYALIIGAVGAITREIAPLILLQHALSIVSALLMYAAVRRLTASAWAGLLPAGMILLGADHIFLEHVVMSESWEVLTISAGLFAAVRTFDQPVPWWRWPFLTGAMLSAAAMIRTAAIPLIAVAAVAILLHGRPSGGRTPLAWRPTLATAASAITILLAYAGANAAFGPGFGVAPSPGWRLYGMAAQFADCRKFKPPPGTTILCETRPASQRPGADFYLYYRQSPARHFGSIGAYDSVLGGWARRAVFAQFGDFLRTAWMYLRTYWVPGSLPVHLRPYNGSLAELDFTWANPFYRDAIKRSLEEFFNPFAVHTHEWALRLLYDWQRVVRFGAPTLFVSSILTLIGLFVGTRRSRLGVFLFGVGGLSLLASPVLGGTYSGRYMIPMAAPLMAGAGITITTLYRALRGRTPGRPGPRAFADP